MKFLMGFAAGAIAWHILRDHMGTRLPCNWGHISRVPAEDLVCGPPQRVYPIRPGQPAQPATIPPIPPITIDIAPGLQRINGLAFFR